MNDELFRLIRKNEGLRLKPYVDTVGKITVGYGRNLTDRGISLIEAENFLMRDVGEVTDALKIQFPWMIDLDPIRLAVMVDMAYNMGIMGLATFHNTLDLIRQTRYEDAADEMGQSLWSRQVGSRAVRLEDMMRTGEWPSDI